MTRRTLAPLEGFSNELGFCLSAMEEVRQQLHEAVREMPAEQICCLAIPGAHSIAALVLHIGEAEWYWIQHILSGRELSEIRSAPCWDVLKEPSSFAAKNYAAEFCLNEIKKIRKQTFETLAAFDDSRLDNVFQYERDGESIDLTLRWILHHLVDHEAQHKGQILMLKRLLAESPKSNIQSSKLS